MSANAIETLGAAIDCAHPITADDHDAVEAAPDALAAVEELLEAAVRFSGRLDAPEYLREATRRVESGQ